VIYLYGISVYCSATTRTYTVLQGTAASVSVQSWLLPLTDALNVTSRLLRQAACYFGAAGNASSWYDTATIVTNVRNFPNNRGAGEQTQTLLLLLLKQVWIRCCCGSCAVHVNYLVAHCLHVPLALPPALLWLTRTHACPAGSRPCTYACTFPAAQWLACFG
jgi:hypothetical protein